YKEFQLDYLLGLQQADQVVCLTNKDLKNYIKINKKSCSIYNPLTIDSKRISELENKIIVFVGRLVIEQKGLDYLISIAKSINKEWKIIVAGDGADKDYFNNMIRDNNLENKIILTGSLKSNELIDLYVKGSIFVSTSRWEGFGLVITEAMSCGLPIVSFNNFGPSEILGNGEYGMLVDNYNLDEFIFKLNELIKSKEKRKELQLKSIERVKSFKMEYILNQWMEVISSITQKR
ncbi:glycosyltransferase, partial [Niallia circulans]|uniref:glycosyltransferase n=1 Tax=Niallia circulans TaxID=1397 RepID=UPI0030089869